MAGRPPKVGIDYAGWDVNVLDGDPKIDRLIDAQGLPGFVIYFYLCQKAYGSNGYFYEWTLPDAATTARKIGGGIGSQAVEQTVRLCLRVGLFEERLFVGHQILTSRGIQTRFLQVAMSRTGNISINGDYWLLDRVEKTHKNGRFIYCTPKSNYGAPKCGLQTSEIELCPPKGKESKDIYNNDVVVVNNGVPKSNYGAPKCGLQTSEIELSSNYALQDIQRHYEKHIGNLLSTTAYKEISEFINAGVEPALICRAIDISIDQNVRKWAYAKQVVNDFIIAGRLTLAQYEAHEANRCAEKARAGSNGGSHRAKGEQPKNRFINFDQRENDYEQIEKLEREYQMNRLENESGHKKEGVGPS